MMKNTLIFTILFISLNGHGILRNKHKNQKEIVETHERMVKEFDETLRSALVHYNQVFSTFQFETQSPQYNMNWSHGSIPELEIKFYVQSESITVCRFDFTVKSFWNHLAETLNSDNQDGEEFRKQAHKCV